MLTVWLNWRSGIKNNFTTIGCDNDEIMGHGLYGDAMSGSRTELTVRYAETDAQGIVHHANYLVWFEEGRSDYLRQQGFCYSELEKAGYYVVVAEAEVRYRAPAYYEDRLIVETSLCRLRRKLLEFRYRIFGPQDRLLVEGRTLHMVLGADRRPTSLPPEFIARLQDSVEEGRS
jgi:acyl-CoA thioester hydrolase